MFSICTVLYNTELAALCLISSTCISYTQWSNNKARLNSRWLHEHLDTTYQFFSLFIHTFPPAFILHKLLVRCYKESLAQTYNLQILVTSLNNASTWFLYVTIIQQVVLWLCLLRHLVQRGPALRESLPQHVSSQRNRHPSPNKHHVPQ